MIPPSWSKYNRPGDGYSTIFGKRKVLKVMARLAEMNPSIEFRIVQKDTFAIIEYRERERG